VTGRHHATKGERLQLGVLVCALVLFALVIGRNFLRSGQAINQNRTALQALCFQRVDLDEQIAAMDRALKKHPAGPIFGIPRAVLVVRLKSARLTRRNLEILKCKEN
jgi:hypothetical protein